MSGLVESFLLKLPFWEHLSLAEQELVRNSMAVRAYSKNETLSSCDTECLGMILLISGVIRVYMLSEDGREITLYRLNAGDTCVMSASCVISQITFDTVISAEQDARVAVLPTSVFSALTEKNIYVREYMYELMTTRFSSVMWVMQQILFKRIDQRLAEFLVRTCERTGQTDIRLTQEEIARDVNTAREVVARMLKQFSADGIVDLKRGCIRVNSLERLRILL